MGDTLTPDLKRDTDAGGHGAVVRTPNPKPIPPEDWSDGALSVPSAAVLLDRTPRTVFSYMDRGLLRWARLGRERRIPKMDVLRLLAGG